MQKWVITIVSIISCITTESSSSVSPALPQIATEPQITKNIYQSLIFAIFGLGFVVGALPYGPLRELYGIPLCSIFHFHFLGL
jgi:MFS family permease